MKFISHRGNIDSIEKEWENHPDKIKYCLNQQYDVEIDVWKIKEQFFLGHDEPQHKIELDFLINDKFWCHAKNLDAFYEMLKIKEINCFWHQEDDFTLTTKGFIWTYPNKILTSNSVAVMPEKTDYTLKDLNICYGICSDIIFKYKTTILDNT